ncbi:type II toxin-antitoxin system Phd/YefM family antitoxin [Bosea sp. (in: a-proteobacteria)]|jgi:antitoxin (DNA-binding transcriptional repressor) of toxin-antitoxin stability system
MWFVTTTHASRHSRKLLKLTEAGQSFLVTWRGQPYVTITPVS